MTETKPLSWQKRRSNYRKQNGGAAVGGPAMTPTQRKRDTKKRNAGKKS